jgi:hypothetical protein
VSDEQIRWIAEAMTLWGAAFVVWYGKLGTQVVLMPRSLMDGKRARTSDN